MKKSTRQSKSMKAYWADPLRGGKRKKKENPTLARIAKLTKKYYKKELDDAAEQEIINRAWSTRKPHVHDHCEEDFVCMASENGFAGTKEFVRRFVIDRASKIEFLSDGSVVLRVE